MKAIQKHSSSLLALVSETKRQLFEKSKGSREFWRQKSHHCENGLTTISSSIIGITTSGDLIARQKITKR